VGEDWDSWLDDDYREICVLRTKGNLNVKGKKIQLRFTNDTLAGKARLKNVSIRAEVLPWLANNLTT
jgi:hypothetical protein